MFDVITAEVCAVGAVCAYHAVTRNDAPGRGGVR
jgi:hypothetical protein